MGAATKTEPFETRIEQAIFKNTSLDATGRASIYQRRWTLVLGFVMKMQSDIGWFSVAVSLGKGGNVSLTKEASGGLTAVTVALGWDERTTTGAAFDLDASALILGENGRVISDSHFVFYGNLTFPPGSRLEDALVGHTGDVIDGGVEGDDESINVSLAALGPEMARIVFPVSIHEADIRGQNFGQVQNAYIRIINAGDGQELVRYDLTEDYSSETALIFGELYRNGAEWKFRAVGQGYASGLAGIVRDFGVNVG